MSEPANWDLSYLQKYLQTPEMGTLALNGPDASVWGSVRHPDCYAPDLIALRPRPKEDTLSAWVTEKAIVNWIRCGCARFQRPSRKHGVIGYDDSAVLRVTFWLTSIVAALVPIASIAVLYSVKSMPVRLVVIAVFNVLVSVCLSALTNAKRVEVFAVTAAFAAVQVVFVGTDKVVFVPS
ncbi:hypothetical protein CC80DRAFT_493765 [Byssothecium circinans]|uniref:DUF6594 domain-containing protein n=1 Tax=Byssothecium circinans TaxID=147558 RepID=A0A6A5TSI9_9PLEO|nr:hypothetical protein CC80DRAFT_493765 [Byssothecium circinans]